MTPSRPVRAERPRVLLTVLPLEDRTVPADGVGSIAIGDVNGSGAPSLIAATAPGTETHVQATYGGSPSYNQAVLPGTVNDSPVVKLPNGMVLFDYVPFTGFSGGVSLASGDFDGDGRQDIVVGAGAGGGPRLQIVSGLDGSVMIDQYVFDASFTGGLSVAADDLDADGTVELIVAAASGGGPHVQVFDVTPNGLTPKASFYAFDPSFTGGVTVATGRLVNRDNAGTNYLIIGAGTGGGPHVKLFDLSGSTPTLAASFFVRDPSDRDGVTVAAITGEYADGYVATTPASGTGNPSVTLHGVSLDDGGKVALGTPRVVALSNLSGPVALTGGGLVYPRSPVFFASQIGSQTVQVYGVKDDNTLMTYQDFNKQVGGKDEIQNPASMRDALAVLPALDPSKTESVTLKDGVQVDVVRGFVTLSMIPTLPVAYASPYTLTYPTNELSPDALPLDVGFDQPPRKNPDDWHTSEPPSNATLLTKEYAPDTIQFTVSKEIAGQTPDWWAQRLVKTAEILIGIHYQHHHDPMFLPAYDAPWDPVTFVPRQVPGTDCSNFTGFLYNFGLGISLDRQTNNQSNLTSAVQYFDDGTQRTLTIDRTERKSDMTYQDIVNALEPGDLLFIRGTGPGVGDVGPDDGTASHVIVWLGNLASSPDGTPLVIDCTGYEHIDSNGVNIPDGVHVRPFAETGANSWYYNSLLRWSSIIPADTTVTTFTL